jgi:hypothetical protein
LEPDRGNDEHVDGDDVAGVVLEEGCPSLRPGLVGSGRVRARQRDVVRSPRT